MKSLKSLRQRWGLATERAREERGGAGEETVTLAQVAAGAAGGTVEPVRG